MTKTHFAKSVLVIGASGFLGKAVFAALQGAGVRVSGTSRRVHANAPHLLPLDVTSPALVAAFPWKDFDCILDCSGNIDYAPTLDAAEENIAVNVLGPLAIMKHLKRGQRYYHCSTHVVLLPDAEQNTYSLSKLMLEQYLRLATDVAPSVIALRLPGIFSEHRHAGVLHRVKKHLQANEPLSLDFRARIWHCMYLPRVVAILTSLIRQECEDPVVTIGYPCETRIDDAVRIAEDVFSRSGLVTFSAKESDGYMPDTTVQSTYVSVTADDFASDLYSYFRAA